MKLDLIKKLGKTSVCVVRRVESKNRRMCRGTHRKEEEEEEEKEEEEVSRGREKRSFQMRAGKEKWRFVCRCGLDEKLWRASKTAFWAQRIHV